MIYSEMGRVRQLSVTCVMMRGQSAPESSKHQGLGRSPHKPLSLGGLGVCLTDTGSCPETRPDVLTLLSARLP